MLPLKPNAAPDLNIKLPTEFLQIPQRIEEALRALAEVVWLDGLRTGVVGTLAVVLVLWALWRAFFRK